MLNNVVALLGNGGGAATAYESIATYTVGAGGVSNVTFSSIPSTYKHLQIRGIMRTNNASSDDQMLIRLNSDGAGNYSYHWVYGDGSSASTYSGTSTGSPWIAESGASGGASNTYSALVIDILDYADTNKYKTIRSLSGVDNNGSGKVALSSASWRSTSATNSVFLERVYGSSISQYSSFALYGIKG